MRPAVKRSKPLAVDPAKVAAFVQRGRGGLKRAAPPRQNWRANNPPPRREDKRLPGARGWKQRVFALYGRNCIACGGRAVQAHHVVGRAVIVTARHLTEDERVDLAYDARNGAPVCVVCHAAHEAAALRIPFDRLPAGAVQWALEHGFRSRVMDRRVYPRQAA